MCLSDELERPTRIVASNLREFLAVNLNDSGLFYNRFLNEEAYLTTKKNWMMAAAESAYQLSVEELSIQEKITKHLKEELHIIHIESPYHFVENAEKKRQRDICIQTQDKLGVTSPLFNGDKHTPFFLNKDILPDLVLLKEYLCSAPVPSRLAPFRDIQFLYVLQDEQALGKIVMDAMINIQLFDEATRLAKDISI